MRRQERAYPEDERRADHNLSGMQQYGVCQADFSRRVSVEGQRLVCDGLQEQVCAIDGQI